MRTVTIPGDAAKWDLSMEGSAGAPPPVIEEEEVSPTWLPRLTVVDTYEGPSICEQAWTAGFYVKGKYKIMGAYGRYLDAVAKCDRENGVGDES